MKLASLFPVVFVLAIASSGIGAEPPATASLADGPESGAGVVLDDATLWRHFHVSGASSIRAADGTVFKAYINWDGREIDERNNANNEKVVMPKWIGRQEGDLPDIESPLPPADWASATFDDSVWPLLRWPQPILNQQFFCNSPQAYERLPYHTVVMLARGKFVIKDPAQVKACSFSLDYWGGVVIYVNGKELIRGDMPEGSTNLAAAAKDYPEGVFTTATGKPLTNDDDNSSDRRALRDRSLRDVQIPAALLRKGVNVLAIEGHQAPVSVKANKGGGWPPIGLIRAHLTVKPAAAAVAPRLNGIRLWNVAAYDTVTAFDYDAPGEPLRPIVVRAARNSVFSGRLMAGSDQPIRGLKATVSDLAQAAGGGKIPASAVRVRYAVPATEGKSWVPWDRFDGLLDIISAEIPVIQARPQRAEAFYHLRVDRSALIPGALAPLWFTVRVPKDAKAGVYQGKVTVAAEGLQPTTVPLRVNVCDWMMPDTQDFRVQNRLYHAEEVEARYYEVPTWSARHFELIGKSLALLAEVNSRQVQANLALEFFGIEGGGNPESLVRWIKQPEGSYKHDYTVFDKFLDMVAKSMGKPANLRLNCWGSPEVGCRGANAVSALDQATGKVTVLKQPALGSAESLAFWQPVFAEVLKKLKARGWLDVTTFGYNSSHNPPSPAMVDVAHKLWPEGEWSFTSHDARDGQNFGGTDKSVVMNVRHADSVWARALKGKAPLYTLDQPRRYTFTSTVRHVYDDYTALREMRRFVEQYALRGGYDGLSEFGADLFPLKRPAGGYFLPPAGRGTQWAIMFLSRPMTIAAILYPGPDGPVATERYEMFREGLELSEAVLFVRHALHEKKLSGDLEQRARQYLYQAKSDSCYTGGERSQAFGRIWFGARYMQTEEDAKLLDLAGEVARELGKRRQ